MTALSKPCRRPQAVRLVRRLTRSIINWNRVRLQQRPALILSEMPPHTIAGIVPFPGCARLWTGLLIIASLSALSCRPEAAPPQDAGQPDWKDAPAACDLDHLPAHQEFVTAISRVLDTPAKTVRLTRLKPWPERWQCCKDDQLERIARQGGSCATGECWTALAEARVPPTDDRGRKHVGFYVYTGSCMVYHDYHYRYGWQLGKP